MVSENVSLILCVAGCRLLQLEDARLGRVIAVARESAEGQHVPLDAVCRWFAARGFEVTVPIRDESIFSANVESDFATDELCVNAYTKDGAAQWLDCHFRLSHDSPSRIRLWARASGH